MTAAPPTDEDALGRLLRHKRAQVDPRNFDNLQPRNRRGPRVVGLRQEDMDVLLGRTPGTYSRFERTGQPKTLRRPVSELLRFTEQQWTSMWLFIEGHHPPQPLYPKSAALVGAHWQEMVNGFRDMAWVTDLAWNVVAINASAIRLFPGKVVPPNIMRWLVLDEAAREESFLQWDQLWVHAALPQLRAAAVQFPDNADLRQLEEDVHADAACGPIYRSLPEAYLQPDGDVRPMRHGELGEGRIQMASATPTGSPGARLMLMKFYPDAPCPRPRLHFHSGRLTMRLAPRSSQAARVLRSRAGGTGRQVPDPGQGDQL